MVASFIRNKVLTTNRSQRIFILAKHDFLQRYYGSVLGVLWAFLNPMFRLLIYYMVFTFLIFKSHDPEFLLYLFLGIMPWSFFSESTKRGMKVLINKRHLIENIQINKHHLFTAHVMSGFFAFVVNMFIYFIFRQFFDVSLSLQAIWMLVLFVNLLFLIYVVSMLLSTLYIFIKDLNHVWDITLMAGFWTVPIIWDQSFIFEHYQFMLYINPITGIIINLREVLLYDHVPHFDLLVYDFAYVAALAIPTLYLFRRNAALAVERK